MQQTQFRRDQRADRLLRQWAGSLAAACILLAANQAAATISTTGNVVPTYPGGGLDPWNVSAELVVGNSANGSLSVSGGSDVTSAGGTIAFNPGVVATATVTGSSSSWTNSQDLTIGVFGNGQLSVLQGAQVSNHSASLGHINGMGTVLVQDIGSEWLNSGDVFIGNSASGSLTIQNQGRTTSATAWVGLNSSAVGVATIDGQNSRWEIVRTLALGDVTDSGQATVTLSGTGSRLYIGPAAVSAGASLAATQTAVIISDTTGLAALSIYSGNKLNSSGNGYVGVGAGESGSVTIVGTGSEWNSTGLLSVGVNGTANITLDSGGTVSAAGLVTIGQQGTIKGNGTIAANTVNNGTVAPGLSAGSLAVTGSYTQSTTGKLQIELFGTAAGQFDKLTATSTASLGGELDVTLGTTDGNPFVPQLGDTFTFLTSTSAVTGNFATAQMPTLAAGRMWQIRYGANATTLAVTPAGDYNDNGIVDASDYVLWRKLNGATLNPRADGDTNGAINVDDFTVWRSRFGATGGAGAAASASSFALSVPEPATVALAWVIPTVVAASRRLLRNGASRRRRVA